MPPMREIEPQNCNNPNEEPQAPPSRKTAYLIGGFGGMITGGSTFLASNALGREDSGQIGGTAFAIGTLAMAGRMSTGISLHEAEDSRDEGNLSRMRLKVAQACFENSIGWSLGSGALSIIMTNSINHAVVTAGAAAALGSAESIREWRRRTRPFPELITPDGNSTKQDLSYPDRKDRFKLPPVFTADSIKDFKEFRDINKRRIIEWSKKVPVIGAKLPKIESAPLLLTSVVILPNIRHFPAMNPEDDNDVRLMDEDDFIIASRVNHSAPFWSEPTIFEDELAGMRSFYKSEWQRWRNRSWKESVAILVQYRNTNDSPRPFREEDPNKVLDRYWLLDIFSDEDGDSEEDEEIVVKRAPAQIPVFQT